MLDIHAAPTVLLYSSGQLVDEFTCSGASGPRVRFEPLDTTPEALTPNPQEMLFTQLSAHQQHPSCTIDIDSSGVVSEYPRPLRSFSRNVWVAAECCHLRHA